MRASLSAVDAARAEARARHRRETLRARLLVATAVATFAVGLVATRTRAARKVPRPAPPAATPLMPAERPAPMPAAPALAAAPEAPAAVAPQPSTTESAANVAAVATCELLCKSHRWRQAAEPCAAAVKARPDDASIVLGLAQSAHARNRMPEAGEWAKRAIALDPTLAEAFIILAHAEARVGDAEAAARDYHRYLSLAPRGWHAREARASLRAHPEP